MAGPRSLAVQLACRTLFGQGARKHIFDNVLGYGDSIRSQALVVSARRERFRVGRSCLGLRRDLGATY